MNKLRYLAAGLFAVAMSFSSFGVASVAEAVGVAPTLVSVVAENTGGTSAKEAGDSIVISFSAQTDAEEIDEDNIGDIFELSGGHSFLDGAGNLGDVDWDSEAKVLTIELSAGTSLPTVSVGDTLTMGEGIDGAHPADEAGAPITGSKVITGSFTTDVDDDEDEDEECEDVTTAVDEEDEDEEEESEEDEDDEDEDDDCDDSGNKNKVCNNALKNGKLYKIGASPTVYLAVKHCTLKPFRGQSAFKARGHKFTDVITLSAVPTGVTVSGEPALPAEGTLVKGTEATVWFISHNGKRKGFVSAEVFTKLGFKFTQVETITDSDLSTMPTDTAAISDDTKHPDGAIVKCGNSPEVFRLKDNTRFPFPNIEVFQNRGHSFSHIALVDCGRYGYVQGPILSEDSE